ncbi:hypothetical protein SME06J_12530 [Serratia marcescens]|nr:hypothetical protein SME06J_12530 [Serratia marcescens]
MHRGKLDTETQCRFMASHAAQFSLNRHRCAANKLKLADAPAGCPGGYCWGNLFQLFAALVVQFAIKCVTVDIFRQQFNINSPSAWQMVKAVAQGGIAVVIGGTVFITDEIKPWQYTLNEVFRQVCIAPADTLGFFQFVDVVAHIVLEQLWLLFK